MASNIISFDGFPEEIRMTEDGRYSVLDVIRFCGKKGERQVWKRLLAQYPEVVGKIATSNYQFPGRGQKLTPVIAKKDLETLFGLMKVHPDQEKITQDSFYPRTEEQIISVLKEAFKDCDPVTQFYCCGYRIDLYLAKDRIAIECDENDHSHYKNKDELKREQSIKSALACSFVRFNPYDPSFNIGSVILEIRQLLGE